MPPTFTPADIILPPIQHRADCWLPDLAAGDDPCDCGGPPPRCSADGTRVHINPTTMQSAYCDGQPMHRWLCTAAGFDNQSRAGYGYGWRQVP